MWRIHTTINYHSEVQDLSPQGPWDIATVNDYIASTLTAFKGATSFDFILIPAEQGNEQT